MATCKHGHERTPENTYQNGWCRPCQHIANRKQYLKRVPEAANRPNTCKWGHEWTPENTYTSPRGTRVCKACRSEAKKALRAHERRMRLKARRTLPLTIDPAWKAKWVDLL